MPRMTKKIPTIIPTKLGNIITKIPKTIEVAPMTWSGFIKF